MTFWRVVFALAAAFNFAVAAIMLTGPMSLAASTGQGPSADQFYLQTSGVMIAVFGLGYAMAARDPIRNRPIIWLGLIGKAAMPILSGLYVRAGLMPLSTFYVSLGDLVFVILFALFLARTRRISP